MKLLRTMLMGLLLIGFGTPAQAIITGELIMLRSEKPFEQAMESLLAAIKQQGYSVAGIRSVDTGLAESGYRSDKYRIVFFEKKQEIASLVKRYPEMLPYLPLKIVIYAEAGDTLLVTSDPAVYIDLYPDPRLRDVFRQWHDEVVNIMKQVQDARNTGGQ
jgi:uncharacterized protein (DUF302 family)